MTIGDFGFFVLAALAVVSGIAVVSLRSPVHCAAALVVNFITLALLYFLLGATFLGITLIMVYAGAIMVLFLFVVMLLSARSRAGEAETYDYRRVVGPLVGLALFGVVLANVVWPLSAYTEPLADPSFGSPQAVGKTLFTKYMWPLEIVGVLLLVGIVGSVLLAKRRVEQEAEAEVGD